MAETCVARGAAVGRERAFHLALKFTAISVSEVELMHFINIKMEAVVSYCLNLYEHITQKMGRNINTTGK